MSDRCSAVWLQRLEEIPRSKLNGGYLRPICVPGESAVLASFVVCLRAEALHLISDLEEGIRSRVQNSTALENCGQRKHLGVEGRNISTLGTETRTAATATATRGSQR